MAAEQLAMLHRTIVAPKVQELAELERRVMDLDQQLDKLDTDQRVTGWHVEADELISKLDDAAVEKDLQSELRTRCARPAGAATCRSNRWGWGRTAGGTYAPPARYRALLVRAANELRTRMQEYLLGDTRATGEEPIPPQYQDFVDRYYRVLTSDGKPASMPGASPPAGAGTK